MKGNYDQCKSKGKIILIHVVVGILMALGFGLVFGYFVMLLWNYLMPDIFSLKVITFWQGAGLVFMLRLLFGTYGKDIHGHHAKKCHPYKSINPNIKLPRSREHYDSWWEEQGKDSFEKYVKNK